MNCDRQTPFLVPRKGPNDDRGTPLQATPQRTAADATQMQHKDRFLRERLPPRAPPPTSGRHRSRRARETLFLIISLFSLFSFLEEEGVMNTAR